MTDKILEALNVFEKLLPKLSDYELDKLICFGEGMAFKTNEKEKETAISKEAKGA